MADNKENIMVEKVSKVQETAQIEKPSEKVEEKYPLKDYIGNSKALGYKKEVVTGALFNSEKDEITKTEFEEMIKNFLGKKVK